MVYTELTRQSIPTEEYRLLLGTALCAFSSNNGFIIENLLRSDDSLSWYELTDKTSGDLDDIIGNAIPGEDGERILEKFKTLVEQRNRIIHGFRCTSPDGEQILATKERGTHRQFYITEEYLKDFIRENDELSTMLHKYRGY